MARKLRWRKGHSTNSSRIRSEIIWILQIGVRRTKPNTNHITRCFDKHASGFGRQSYAQRCAHPFSWLADPASEASWLPSTSAQSLRAREYRPARKYARARDRIVLYLYLSPACLIACTGSALQASIQIPGNGARRKPGWRKVPRNTSQQLLNSCHLYIADGLQPEPP